MILTKIIKLRKLIHFSQDTIKNVPQIYVGFDFIFKMFECVSVGGLHLVLKTCTRNLCLVFSTRATHFNI